MGKARAVTVSALQLTAIDGEKEATVEKMMALLDVAGTRDLWLAVSGEGAPQPFFPQL